jgi:AAA domain
VTDSGELLHFLTARAAPARLFNGVTEAVSLTEEASPSAEDEPAPVIDVVDLARAGYSPPKFVVDTLIPQTGLVLLSGDTGACKSSLSLHIAFSVACGLPVAKRFQTFGNGRPVLYVNGEMGRDILTRFVYANAAGLDVDLQGLAPGRIYFEGADGFADLLFAGDPTECDSAMKLQRLVKELRPVLILLDTFRALFTADEGKTPEVRATFRWLGNLAKDFDTAIVVGHHYRKVSQVSNAPRERVSGVRDLIAGVDVHLTLRSPSGKPVSALLLEKTRTPFGGIGPGTEWPIESRWIDEAEGVPARSTFSAGEPAEAAAADASAKLEAAKGEILELLLIEPRTRKEIDCDKAGSRTRRRALESLLNAGDVIVMAQKKGRSELLGLPGTVESLFDEGE